MLTTSTLARLKYVLDETRFHESQIGYITIYQEVPFGVPAASFTLQGGLLLSEDNRKLTISVNAKGPNFPPHVSLVRVYWKVTATLMDGDLTLDKQRVVQHYEGYIAPAWTSIVGEAIFVLPEPNEHGNLTLFLEGSYVANFGPHGNAQPYTIPIAMKDKVSFVRKNFTIRVEHER